MTIKKYEGSAGGWGALLSTTKHLVKSENVSRNIRNLLKTNQDKGFDCPGCAWGESKEQTRFKFCENGAKAVNWEATSRRVTPAFFAQHPVSWLTQQSDYFLESQGRLSHPVKYNSATDCYEAVSWQQAYTLIAEHLNALTKPSFIHPVEQAMKRPFYINFLCVSLARITFQIVPICVTKPVE